MVCVKWVVVWLISLSYLGCNGRVEAGDPDSPTYEKDIKPLFAQRCTVCHRASKRSMVDISGGLALDSLEGILAGSARHKVIVPGKSGQSELVRRLADPDEDRRMPLQDKPLAPAQLELVARWIDAGAPRGSVQAIARKGRRIGASPGAIHPFARRQSTDRRQARRGQFARSQGGRVELPPTGRPVAGRHGPRVSR